METQVIEIKKLYSIVKSWILTLFYDIIKLGPVPVIPLSAWELHQGTKILEVYRHGKKNGSLQWWERNLLFK